MCLSDVEKDIEAITTKPTSTLLTGHYKLLYKSLHKFNAVYSQIWAEGQKY